MRVLGGVFCCCLFYFVLFLFFVFVFCYVLFVLLFFCLVVVLCGVFVVVFLVFFCLKRFKKNLAVILAIEIIVEKTPISESLTRIDLRLTAQYPDYTGLQLCLDRGVERGRCQTSTPSSLSLLANKNYIQTDSPDG